MTEHPAVPCRACGHGYPEHDADGGHCLADYGGQLRPEHAIPCPCPGFRWVDPGGPVVGYSQPPRWPSAE